MKRRHNQQQGDHNIDINISTRQRHILAIIVEQYVSTARPVASEHIVGTYYLNISSATVRNDMVELERAGLIAQPHTSAGRVPSDRGYRFFVENLMTPSTLPANEQRKIRHQFHQIEMDANEWVQLATAVLARSVQNVAVATAPRSAAVRLKHFELLSISEKRILVVLVGHDGTVTQQMLTLEAGWDQENLSTLSARLNAALAGKTSAEISDWAKGQTPAGTHTAMSLQSDSQGHEAMSALARQVLSTLVAMLVRLESPNTIQIYHEGLSHMLEQPEFQNPESAQQLLALFEHNDVWPSLISSVLEQDGVQVIIGDDKHGGGMSACSIVLARYGMLNQMTGVLGVIGPMRMPYSRSVSTVRYMSQLLSDMLYRTYSPQLPEGDM